MNGMELYGSIAAAREVGISLRQLYYWVDILHVVQPQVHQHGTRSFRRFTVGDVERLRRMQRLLKQGYTLRASLKRVKESSG